MHCKRLTENGCVPKDVPYDWSEYSKNKNIKHIVQLKNETCVSSGYFFFFTINVQNIFIKMSQCANSLHF